MISLTVSLDDDPLEVANWVARYEHHRLQQASRAEAEPMDGQAHPDPELEDELERFRANWPAYTERFNLVHEGLLRLGYVPVLPRKRKPTSVRAYIAYHLPDGRRVFEVNSSTAYLAGNEFKARVLSGGHDALRHSRESLSIQFDTTDKVDLVLQIAAQEIQR